MGTTVLGKWRLDALLGVGGMAAVYAATHRNGARGALKMLHPDLSRDAEMQSRFLREGYIANAVLHHGAVRILDDDVTEDGSTFLVMELLEGMALHELAAQTWGALPAEQVLRIADQLLDALAAAHDKGIIHRDIKPENVFLTTEGKVKILDFGIAHAAFPAGEMATQSGVPMGTPAFMAPEQARGRWDLVGPRSDVWSVGATLFTLLSGEHVHPTGTATEVLAASFMRPARSLREVMPHLPMPLVDLVDGALKLQAMSRWSDARAMQAAVRATYQALYGAPLPASCPSFEACPRSADAPPPPSSPKPAEARPAPAKRRPFRVPYVVAISLLTAMLAAIPTRVAADFADASRALPIAQARFDAPAPSPPPAEVGPTPAPNAPTPVVSAPIAPPPVATPAPPAKAVAKPLVVYRAPAGNPRITLPRPHRMPRFVGPDRKDLVGTCRR